MRLRYRTEDPPSIWHTMVELGDSREVPVIRNLITKHCREYFGAQFFRYGQIHISLHAGAEVMAAFSVIPAELASQKEATEAPVLERVPAA